ncbi:hypothetical protein [Enterococcus sp. AZ177]|uniref:hypothetical protein n=1 Tax=unclassified Enterococcus TaxID=2608891 RepID=UPI003D2FB164
MNQHETPIKVEVSHTLARDQLEGIYQTVYSTTLQAIKDARRDSEIDNDMLYSKAALCRFLDNMSANYLEELLAKGLPQGRTLSERKICFSKIAVKRWLLENEENSTMPME